MPPVTDVGFKVSEDNVTGGGGAGFTVRVADLFAPPKEPLIVTDVVDETTLVETLNVAVVAPPATTTLVDTDAAEVLLLESVTTAPPAGAALDKVIVP